MDTSVLNQQLSCMPARSFHEGFKASRPVMRARFAHAEGGLLSEYSILLFEAIMIGTRTDEYCYS